MNAIGINIITSYKPSPADIKGEETGEGLTEKLNQYAIYRKNMATLWITKICSSGWKGRSVITPAAD